jgi:glycosyltransferase 2 family protein
LNNSTKKFLRTIIFTFVGIIILYFVFRKTDFNSFKKGLENANYFWVFAAMIVGLVGHWLRASRWTLVIESLGYKVKTYPAFLAVISGYFINLAIPRAGEVSRCALMGKASGVPVQNLIGTVITERIIDLIMTIGIVFLVLFLQFEKLFSFTNTLLFIPIKEKLLNLYSTPFFIVYILIFVIFFLGFAFLYRKLRKKSKGKKSKLASILLGFVDGIKSIFLVKKPFLYIIQTFGIWISYLFSTFFILKAFPFSTFENIYTALSVLLFSTIGVIVPAPGGVGSIYTIQEGLTQIYAYSEENATLVASLLFFAQVVVFILLGTYALIHLGILKNKQNATKG